MFQLDFPHRKFLVVAGVVAAAMSGARPASAATMSSAPNLAHGLLHAGTLVIPDFEAITMSHLPPSQEEYYNPYNPNNEEEHRIFGLPKFHKAKGAAHHTNDDPENPSVKKKGLTRIGSVSTKLYASNIGQVLEICPGASQPILRGQLATERLRTVFDALDTDGDGDLQLHDIRECFNRLNLNKSEEELEELFARMDVDRDQKITFHEFHSAIHMVSASAGEQEGLLETLQLHPGTWIRHLPDDIPNLEIEPRYYRSQWIGEDKLGGGWSSESSPLSGDRPKMISEMLSQDQNDIPQGKTVTKDADGNLHTVSKKTTDTKVDTKRFLHPLSSSLLI
mmetsp:Transcript_8545/g.20184  ORF Transcript_8545/g.20184 Transcript_8545/m.20184 type:complete len:336 (-) Transcript_8545:172-1179(-)|eukprot:CAMPEP_0177710434 /NCGR_PEP_ID=MMETSP0484_2-20121128/11334_1 /TAXON_ID=354590 /ORGANISM="Rhodomonas lens, Strain RHODO" /LENGTH=335 /DNA_ID=CAMNT_0019222117 /DNA_START=55 /DNA_END=1062 /DNA_ORIENTATION=+